MMDHATKARFRAFRERALPAAVHRAAAPPPDTRPRYKDGRLRDLRSHLEESLDWDLINASDDPRSAAYVREHQAEIDLYLSRFGAAQRREAYDAQEREDYERAAARLGVTVDDLLDESKAEEIRVREHNAALDDEIAAIEAKRRPIPEPEPEPAAATE